MKLILPESEKAKFERWTEKLSHENTAECRKVLVATTLSLVRKAMMFAPVDMGLLRSSIRPKFEQGGMSTSVYTVRRYAPYVEFGTGKGVVAPDDVREYAMTFKGRGVRKVNQRAQPYLFPAWRLAQKELMEKLKQMGFEKK
jgi:hypothetical protein